MAILAAQILMPMDSVMPETSGLAPRRIRPISLPPPVDDRAILAAPIFAPDRRPGVAGEAAGATVSPMAGFAALGSATGRAVSAAAIMLPSGQTQVMHRGDLVDGWRLVSVGPARLTFARQGERHVLVVGAPAAPLNQPADGTPARAGVQ